MRGRCMFLVLTAAAGCAGDAPDVEPLDTSLRGGSLTAEFDGAPFEVGYGLFYFDEDAGEGRLLLSTDPVMCPYVDHATVTGIHVSCGVSSIEPGAAECAHEFWQVTDTSSLDYRYPAGALEVTDVTDDAVSGSLELGGAEALLEGTFEVGRCGA